MTSLPLLSLILVPVVLQLLLPPASVTLLQLPILPPPHLPLQFFNFVALPMYQSMAQAFPGCTPILEAVKANCAMWAEREQEAASKEAAAISKA